MDARALLNKHGLRCTRQRELLYDALASTKTHPTADELLTAVRRVDPSISLATVYNSLDAFTRGGLCRRLAPGRSGGPCRYDADLASHVHAIARDGRVIDLPAELERQVLDRLGPGLVGEIEARLGTPIQSLSFQGGGTDHGS